MRIATHMALRQCTCQRLSQSSTRLFLSLPSSVEFCAIRISEPKPVTTAGVTPRNLNCSATSSARFLDSSMFSELPLPSLAKPSSKMFCPVYFRSVMNATTQSRSILALLSSSLPLLRNRKFSDSRSGPLVNRLYSSGAFCATVEDSALTV